jgi:hypothetical protein
MKIRCVDMHCFRRLVVHSQHGDLGWMRWCLDEVTYTEDLSIKEAYRRFPREAKACLLRRMAKRWRGGKVRCIVLSNSRPAPEYINL